MAFWGVEVKPGKPHSLRFEETGAGGRLHLSKATLGVEKSSKISSSSKKKRSLVQCIVGDKKPVLLCSLKPDHKESTSLHIEFSEYDEVVFSVLGNTSVHLAGYFVDRGANFDADGDDIDSYGEDIGETDSENSSDYDYGSSESDDDGFIHDGVEEEENDEDDSDEFGFIGDDDIEMFSPKKPKSGVVIEEIMDDDKPANENGDSKRAMKKSQVSASDGDNRKQIIVSGGPSIFESESEDEDGLPVSSRSKAKDESVDIQKKPNEKVSKKSKKKTEGADTQQVIGTKRKNEDVQDGETERPNENPSSSSLQSSEVGRENADKPKKKKKKDKSKVTETPESGKYSKTDVHQEDEAKIEREKTDDIMQEPDENEKSSTDKRVEIVTNNIAGEDTSDKKKKKNKKKKKKNMKNETSESDRNGNTEEPKKGSVVEIEDKKTEMKRKQERSYPNGLVVEELEMGKPDGKRASPGNKVSVCYIGKLQKNGKIFDSNTNRKAPFQFHLGVGQVIKGWDVGVNGMRVGDKRRLTIPPSMGYGSKKTGPIPPNAWLVFDVELIAVR